MAANKKKTSKKTTKKKATKKPAKTKKKTMTKTAKKKTVTKKSSTTTTGKKKIFASKKKLKPAPEKPDDYECSAEERAILDHLDEHAERFEFPVLDNGYIYLAAARLHVFSSLKDWAIVVQQLGFFYRLDDCERFDCGVYAYGSCIEEPGLNSIWADNAEGEYVARIGRQPIDNAPSGNLLAEDEEYIDPNATSFLLRGREVAVNHDRGFYAGIGIELSDKNHIQGYEFLRGLVPEHRNELLFDDASLRRILPPGIDEILTLDDWHHPAIGQPGNKPSESEVFRQLAKVLVTKDVSHYSPSLPGNTHWKNWPAGGSC